MDRERPDPRTPGEPLVSVAITAYNRADALPRAIESALAQRTDFPIEVVISDDCSTDDTFKVVMSYQERYPGIVRGLKQSKNIGMMRNYFETFEHCRGKFIAWLDSDDYWTNPEKLSKQTQLMESDPTVMVCGHRVRWVNGDGEVQREMYPVIPEGRYGMEEILRRNIFPSPSVVFRNGIQRELPEWYFDLAPVSDWPVFVVGARMGAIVLMDEVMADYVLSPDGAYWGKGHLFWYLNDVRFYDHVESIVPPSFHRIIKAEKGRRYETVAYLLRKRGDFEGSRKAAFKAFSSPLPTDNVVSKTKTIVAALVREAGWRARGSQAAPQS